MNRLEVVMQHINYFLERSDRLLVAIEGSCTSGKTTLAAQLREVYDCNVFHMDEFFLRPEQRTAARYAEVGGNVDYERFYEEILLPLRSGAAFSYRPFNCKTRTLSPAVSVPAKKLNIIEGSYSLHPYFRDPYDLKILLTVTPDLQRQRILERPQHLQESFFTKWIPLENTYLEAFRISEKADIIL